MALLPCPECGRKTSSEAEACPHCGYPIRPKSGEPEFRAYVRRVLVGTIILCVIALLIGMVLDNPAVWGLSILGLIVGGWKLHRMGKRRAIR